MNLKKTAMIAGAAVVTMALAGCHQNGNSNDSSSKANTQMQTTTAATATCAAKKGSCAAMKVTTCAAKKGCCAAAMKGSTSGTSANPCAAKAQ